MNKRDIFLPSLSTLLIFGLVVFLSCAHQNRVADEFGNEVEENQEQVSENASESVEGSTEEVAQTEEAAKTAEQQGEQAVDELSQSAEQTTQQTNEVAQTEVPMDQTQAAAGTDDLGLPQDSQVAPTQPTEGDQLLGDSSLQTPPPSDTTAATGTDPLAIPPVDTAQTEAPQESVAPPPSSQPTWDTAKHSAPTFSGVSRVPHIPTSAVHKKGTLLNRFYFTRRGDNPANVSELVYGNTGKAKSLRKWNAGTWGAGKVVYYASPSSPEDTQMKSFYQERGISPEEYTVQRGDWLSKVASTRLGHSNSWKEIAVINGMDRPDKLEVGQRIAIYPKDLRSAPHGEQQITKMDQEEQPIAQAQPQVQEPVAPPTAVVEPPVAQVPPQQELQPMDQAPAPQQPVAPVIESPRAKLLKNGSSTSKLLEQNLFFIVIGAGILALLGALMLVNKRKKARADEFGDEGFPAPTKLKRK